MAKLKVSKIKVREVPLPDPEIWDYHNTVWAYSRYQAYEVARKIAARTAHDLDATDFMICKDRRDYGPGHVWVLYAKKSAHVEPIPDEERPQDPFDYEAWSQSQPEPTPEELARLSKSVDKFNAELAAEYGSVTMEDVLAADQSTVAPGSPDGASGAGKQGS